MNGMRRNELDDCGGLDTQQHNFEERAGFVGCGVMGVGAN